MKESGIYEGEGHIRERRPETELDCIDEINDIIYLMEGLTNMFVEVTEGRGSASDEKTMMIEEAYKGIIIREAGWAMNRLETVSEVLYRGVLRRGRIRRAVRKTRERRKMKQTAVSAG